MSYLIGSFNTYKMGEQTVQQRLKDWKLIARIINNSNIDIVALQEIFSEKPVAELQRYMNFYGCKWDYRFAQKETVRNEREGYAFLWNTKRISLLRDSDRIFEPHIEAKWSRSLIRPPFVGRFMPVGFNTPFIEIRIINTHIVYSKDRYMERNENDWTSLELRKNEYRKLSKAVFPQIAHERFGVFRDAYTLITGDYNLCLQHCLNIDAEPSDERISISSRQHEKTTLSKLQADLPHLDPYSNDYDHFSFSEHESPYVHQTARIDAPRNFCGGNFDYYRQNISDHVPIILHLDVKNSLAGDTACLNFYQR